MTPPRAPLSDVAGGEGKREVYSVRLSTLRKRSDFQSAARSARVATPGFILQMRHRAAGEAAGIRVGFTCSKKVGNAVARNRAKRRLREIARLTLPAAGRNGADYVLIGRAEITATRPFPEMMQDLARALAKLHGERR